VLKVAVKDILIAIVTGLRVAYVFMKLSVMKDQEDLLVRTTVGVLDVGALMILGSVVATRKDHHMVQVNLTVSRSDVHAIEDATLDIMI